MPEGSLQLVSRTGASGQGADLGYHIHPDDLRAVAAAYEAALVDDEAFDLEGRICDRHGGSYAAHCWFGLRVGRGATAERLILLERPLPQSGARDGHAPPRPLPLPEVQHREERDGEMFAFIAHQLRSPVTTIMGNAHVLRYRAHALSREQRSQALEDLVHSTDRLCKLLDDLLRFAGVSEVSRSESEADAIALPDLVGEVVDRHAKVDPSRELSITAPVTLPAALGSGGFVDQIVDNLITNARKYSPPGTPVDVSLEAEGDRVNIRVLDRGIGIDAKDSEHIFTPFYRAARVTGLADGAGIGLAVSKRLAESIGARITARPRPGGGSEFTLSLRRALDPVALPTLSANVPAPDADSPIVSREIA